jgi:hypothetical protein
MDGLMPTMKSGDIHGHEFMGEVIETGSAGHKLKKERVSYFARPLNLASGLRSPTSRTPVYVIRVSAEKSK